MKCKSKRPFRMELLSEGGRLPDPAGFVRRLNEMFLALAGGEKAGKSTPSKRKKVAKGSKKGSGAARTAKRRPAKNKAASGGHSGHSGGASGADSGR